MILRDSVTRGDILYGVIAFVDKNGNPYPLGDIDFSMDFKYEYGDNLALFSLSLGSGLGFVGDDANSGELFYKLTEAQTETVTINATKVMGVDVPVTTIYADLKITPPAGVYAVPGSKGPRIKLFVEVQDDIT